MRLLRLILELLALAAAQALVGRAPVIAARTCIGCDERMMPGSALQCGTCETRGALAAAFGPAERGDA